MFVRFVIDKKLCEVSMDKLPLMEWWVIDRIDHEKLLKEELERIGLFSGTQVRKVRSDFWGGPCAYEFLGSCSMLRKDMAEKIFCKPA